MKAFRALSVSLVAALAAPAAAAAAIPTQFIAKTYTEALGRAPDPGAFNSMSSYYANSGCSVSTLQTMGAQVLNSQEFSNLGYSSSAKVLVLYRAILDREPDSGGYSGYVNQLNSGTPFSTLVGAFYGGSEFATLASRICSGQPYFFAYNRSGGYAAQAPESVTVSESAVQQMLDNASTNGGGTVSLPSMALVPLTSSLRVHAGTTLTTTGGPDIFSHAKMARLVRSSSYSSGAALVIVEAGGHLANVWVDGQRGVAPMSNGLPRPYAHDDINIQAVSGNGTSVTSNFVSNSAGWTSIQMFGSGEVHGVPCTNAYIQNNMITSYASVDSSTSQAGEWSDGISDACEGSTVSGNNIVDASDGAIVLFRSQTGGYGAPQMSQVTNNIIVSAGNFAFGALILDQLSDGCTDVRSFSGSSVGSNTFYAGSNTGFTVGIAIGTDIFSTPGTACTASGANVSNNSNGGIVTRVVDGIVVQGMLNATVQSNNLTISSSPISGRGSCPAYPSAAAVSAGRASGSLQSYTDVALPQACVNSH